MDEETKGIISKIKEKKEFSEIPDEDIVLVLESLKTRDGKEKYFGEELIKLARNKLRIIYSGFGGRKIFNFGEKEVDEILKKHLSTRERYEYYEEVYSRLLKWFEKEKSLSVIDLGSGVNGFSYGKLETVFGGKINYTGIEAVGQLVDLTNGYFKNKKLKAKAIHASLFEKEKVLKLIEKEKEPRVIFMFKVVDALESLKRNYTLEFLKDLKKFLGKKDVVVVSFATESWFKRKKFYVQRNWLTDFVKENFEFIDDFNPKGERYFVFRKE